jgi:DNA polymerase-3 subunit delta'
MRWDEIQYQPRAVSILGRALVAQRVHHAYLFAGPEGVGKEATARVLAARLLCQNAESDPNQGALFGAALPDERDACGTCDSCRLLEGNNHPDYAVIDRALHRLHPDPTIRKSKGLFLGVEVIRHFLIEPSALKPTISGRRVFVIREAERMNEAAQNALLKTLEEPPGQTVLILVSSSAGRLLATIRSRCQQIPFVPLPRSFVAEQLEAKSGVSADQAAALAGLSDGQLGKALRWHRIELLSVLPQLTALLQSHRSFDPEPFGKQVLELAEVVGQRLVKLEGAEAEESDYEDAVARSSSRTLSTDTQRAAFKLILMLIAACYRDALVQGEAGLKSGTKVSAVSLLPAGAVGASLVELADDAASDAIAAVATAEHAVDRNVALQLVAEQLATALPDG